MGEMRALTIKQPHAGAIMWVRKDVENRTRPTKYRGHLWVHAGLAHPDYGEFRYAFDLSRAILGQDGGLNWSNTRVMGKQYLEESRRDGYPHSTHVRGSVLGSVEVFGCHHADDCNHICPEPDDWDDSTDLPCTEHLGPCRNHCSPWALPGQWHWLLRDARPLPEPVPCKGRLGLWRLPEDVEKAVRAQQGEDGNHG